MPTYDYECQKCGHHFEAFQSMTADRLTACPEEKCKGKLKRLIGAGAGLIFKGSGFYITDYRSDSYKKAAKKDSAPSSSGESSKSAEGSKTKGKSGEKSSSSGSGKKKAGGAKSG
ncbi:MAG: zinc ribbon domain-containing protein [Verrucomicrobia bacterium]|nr:zinc ribbon domain-containing protein [Verrucomicrobiota bacterium]